MLVCVNVFLSVGHVTLTSLTSGGTGESAYVSACCCSLLVYIRHRLWHFSEKPERNNYLVLEILFIYLESALRLTRLESGHVCARAPAVR